MGADGRPHETTSKWDEKVADRLDEVKSDCGCGCEGAGDCLPTKVAHRRPVVVPGLVHSSPGALGAKALAHLVAMDEDTGHRSEGVSPAATMMVKVGLVGSHDPLVQGVEAVASSITPGDAGPYRSPVRSAVARTLTPGGGNNHHPLEAIGRTVANAQRRCPPGFEHGGRFTNAALGNCGARIFDIVDGPDIGAGSLIGAVRRTITGNAFSTVSLRRVGAGIYGDSPIESRLPEVGKIDKGKVMSAIDEAVAAASSSQGGFMRFVRKDGVAIKPLANVDKLARLRNHPEMVGSTLVTSAMKPDNIGGNEIRLLGNGLDGIVYAMPGGHTFTLRPKGDLTPRRASALSRQLSSIRQGGDEHGRALQLLADRNPEFLTLAVKYQQIDGATDMVVMERDGQRRTVQKWAYLTWYAGTAPGRVQTSSPWRLVTANH